MSTDDQAIVGRDPELATIATLVAELRQTLIGVAAGHRLDEHENNGEITLQLLRGRARVVAAADDTELVAGDYAVIPRLWDSFEALEDTVVLLTAAVRGSAG